MSRLRDKGLRAALSALIAWLLALGLGLPLLKGFGLEGQMLRFAVCTAGLSGVFSLLRTRKYLFSLSLLLAAAAAGVHYLLGGGWIQSALNAGNAIAMHLRGAGVALPLYGDTIALQLTLYCALLGTALASPDNGLYAPIFIVGSLLCSMWLLGLRGASAYMLPALPALLLLYAWTHARDPEGDTPQRRSMPAIALVAAAALCALSMALAPADGTKVPALAQLADRVSEILDDTLLFREQRSRYSLALDGWMPQGEGRLGGEPSPSDRIVMQVETDETVYLRGAILDTYTGGAWYDSISAQRYGWYSRRYRELRDQLTQAAYPLVSAQSEKMARVIMLTDSASTLFVPQRLRTLTVEGTANAYFNLGTEVFLSRNLQPRDTYTVEYLPMKATDAGMAALVASNQNAQDAAYADAQAQYTDVPGHMQQDIYDIVQRVTQGCNTPWEKTVALRDYLQNTCTYTLQVQTPPTDVDFVAWFLLAERQGYCTYFASAMTVMCRMAGLPARYIEGYLVRPEAGGTTVVRGLNAHAWTEVYLRGVGWVTFDATPGAGDQDQSNTPDGSLPPEQQEQPTPTPEPAPTPTPSPTPEAQPTPTPTPAPEGATPTPSPTPEAQPTPTPTPPPQDPPKDPGPRLPWLALLLLLALMLLLAWRARLTEPMYRAARAKDDAAALLLLWQAALQCAAQLGKPRQHAETPLAYAARLGDSLGVSLQSLAETVSAVQYGRHMPSSAAVQEAGRVYTALNEQLNLWQKAVLCLRRMLHVTRRR